MIDNISFTLNGWEEYAAWQSEDKRTLKKINRLIYKVLDHGNVLIAHCNGHYGDK